jgi:putative restriction endonuclease
MIIYADPMYNTVEQALIRLDIFQWLEMQLIEHDWITKEQLLGGYSYRGQRIPLIPTQQGIHNPRGFDETLSVVSTARSKYEDMIREDGMIEYDYESQSVEGYNTKLRLAHVRKTPIIYLKQIKPGIYKPSINVYVIGDDQINRKFILDFRSTKIEQEDLESPDTQIPGTERERKYAVQQTLRRLHQPQFRASVLYAYSEQCAICRLKHPKLLDAAHIVPDKHELGVAKVSNGLALCKIHHAALDQKFIGITPDYKVDVDKDLLEEVDGPMLKHGIQEMNGITIQVPTSKQDRPDPKLLEISYSSFLSKEKIKTS